MEFLIGGLSPEQYKRCLPPTEKSQAKWAAVNHWVARFNIARYPALTVFFYQIAYFILHGFSDYPNPAYLFEKFKSHDFSKDHDPEQAKTIRKIFERFKCCADITEQELGEVETKINPPAELPVPKVVEPPVPKVVERQVHDPKVVEPLKPVELRVLEPVEPPAEPFAKNVDKNESASPLSKAEQRRQRKAERKKRAREEKAKQDALRKQAAPDGKKSDSPIDREKKSGSGGDAGIAKDDGEDLFGGDLSDDNEKHRDEKPQTVKDPIRPNLQLVLHKDGKSALTSGGAKKVNDGAPFSQSIGGGDESTLDRLKDLLDLISTQKDIEDDEDDLFARDDLFAGEDIIYESLPRDVAKIVSEPFDLTDPQSSPRALFLQGKPGQKSIYSSDLKKVLDFANKLHEENKQTDDPRFYAYLEEMDQVFQKELALALEEADALHQEFKNAFPGQSPEALKSNEVLCSAAQLDWLVETLSSRFPYIYQLAFDCPLMNIFQDEQLAEFARQILLGKEVEVDDLITPCFIRLDETDQRTTNPFENDGDDNPLVKAGSYIMTQFIGSHHRLQENESEVKRKLHEMAGAYVQDWLNGTGSSLEFGKHVFVNDEDAADWSAFVRDSYTATLMGMTKEQLQNEVLCPSFNCPLIQMISNVYKEDIDSLKWKESQFPSEILEKIFNEEFWESRHNPLLQENIQQLIDDSCFENDADIAALAAKADCAPNLIEPLIRIRLFYILCTLGKNEIKPVVRGIKQRASSFVHPESNNSLLDCQPSKEGRVLAFDDRLFDNIQLFVDTTFKTPEGIHPMAQGESVLCVSSLNQPATNRPDTSIVDLQGLRFSVHAPLFSRRYLTAQVAPQTLLENMERLETKVELLEIVGKVEKFRKAERENKAANDKRHFWNSKIPFDISPYRDSKRDTELLEQVILAVNTYVSYLNTYTMLDRESQLTPEQVSSWEESRLKIITEVDDVLRAMGTMYSDDPDDKVLRKVKVIREKLDIDFDILDAEDYESEESPRDDLESSSEDDLFNADLGRDTERTIGKPVEAEAKSYSSMFVEALSALSPMRLLTQETSEVKFFRWKVKRYEDLIRAAQKSVLDYIEQNNLCEIEQLVRQAKQPKSPEWLRQLAPVLQFCQLDLRNDKGRMNLEYLKAVRESYNESFFAEFRKAEEWAKAHPTMPGVEHINGISHQFHTSIVLNERCQKIFDTFIALGKEMTKGKKPHSHPHLSGHPKYALINELFEAHQLIKSVPNDAKAPLIKQWANSLRGHLNGILGMATFDPNLQSNPVHVFFEKKIFKNENGARTVHCVKDIAMGSPTIETGNGIATINPEFQGFLRHCQAEGLVHLYINNQDYRPKSMVDGDESVRCQSLHDLAENEFKDTLHVITLSQNSTFYQQHGHEITRRVITRKGIIIEEETNARAVKDAVVFQVLDGSCKGLKNYLPSDLVSNKDLHRWMAQEIDRIHQEEFGNCVDFIDPGKRDVFIQRFHQKLREHVDLMRAAQPGEDWGYSIYDLSAARFQEELVAQMFDRTPEETGNCIPADLVDKYKLRDWSVDMAASIHRRMFGGRDDLTVQERRIFIRLFYRNLARKILVETKANTYNESCKDRIDRGAASEAEDYAYLAILKNCMNKPEVIAFFKMLVFARAIIVRKRSIIEERLERLIETVKFMIDHQKELQDLHAELFPGIEMTIDQFALPEDEVADLY